MYQEYLYITDDTSRNTKLILLYQLQKKRRRNANLQIFELYRRKKEWSDISQEYCLTQRHHLPYYPPAVLSFDFSVGFGGKIKKKTLEFPLLIVRVVLYCISSHHITSHHHSITSIDAKQNKARYTKKRSLRLLFDNPI